MFDRGISHVTAFLQRIIDLNAQYRAGTLRTYVPEALHDSDRGLEELIETLRAEGSILKEIKESGDLTDETVKKLDEELKKAQKSFNVQEKASLVS